MTASILQGDVIEQLATLPDESVQCVVTSPPYWGLRDYGHAGQIGLEPDFRTYVARMVEVFAEVRRVLRPDGVLWLNLGDSYANDGKWGGETGGKQAYLDDNSRKRVGRDKRNTGLKPKDLVGIPWRVAFALQADGWWLRQDIIWHKPNPMPHPVRDRCTGAHEYVFLLTKSERYFFDCDAISEPAVGITPHDLTGGFTNAPGQKPHGTIRSQKLAAQHQEKTPIRGGTARSTLGFARSGNKERKPATARGCPSDGVSGSIPREGTTRNRRSVWTIASEPYPEAHFATFPSDLPRLCILAGSRRGDPVLDPFAGSGTTLQVALELGREAVGIELNPEYVHLIRARLAGVTTELPLEVAA